MFLNRTTSEYENNVQSESIPVTDNIPIYDESRVHTIAY